MVIHRENILQVFRNILSEAFGLRQAAGGITGYAVSVGIRRGIFSNEAGLGSSPALHSAAESSSPETMGACSMLEVLIDMLCCTLTALALLCSGEGESIQAAFSAVTGSCTEIIIAALMSVFAFCTVIGWYYCGETAFVNLAGSSRKRLFSVIYAITAASGALTAMRTVWALSDIFNGLMAIPNLLALILLIRKVKER